MIKQQSPGLPTPLAGSGSTEQSTNGPHRVLVVEDHEDTRFMLRTLLEMKDFYVLEAEDGKAAVAVALKEHPDIILMDYTLPGMDGLTATQAIREDHDIGRVPIVFLSGVAETPSIQAALDAGCNDYVVKPVNLDDVISAIRRCLKTQDGEQQPNSASAHNS